MMKYPPPSTFHSCPAVYGVSAPPLILTNAVPSTTSMISGVVRSKRSVEGRITPTDFLVPSANVTVREERKKVVELAMCND